MRSILRRNTVEDGPTIMSGRVGGSSPTKVGSFGVGRTTRRPVIFRDFGGRSLLFAGWSWPLLNSSGVHYSSTDHAAPNRQPRPRLPRLCRRECWCVEISEAAVGPRFLLAASK